MADKIMAPRTNARGSALDLPMSALAGGSVAFFTFAMPADLFERLVGASGLPALLPAAQPPLGDTAKLAFVTIAAIAAFVLSRLLLRALDEAPAVTTRSFDADVVEQAPRLRRADMHPDAPSRRPIHAGSDFAIPLDSVSERGEPADLLDVENVDYDAEWERPAPSFLTRDDESEPEAFGQNDEPAPEVGETYDAPAQAEPIDVPFWIPEHAEEPQDAAIWDEVELDRPRPVQGAGTILPFWAQQVANEPAEDVHQASEPSLDQLSNRFEGGLIRRKRDGRSTRPRGHGGVDDRLRGALDDLGKVTRRR